MRLEEKVQRNQEELASLTETVNHIRSSLHLSDAQHLGLQVLLATALEFGAREGRFARAGDRIHLAGWTPRLDDGAQSIRSAILKMLKDNPLQTPRPKDLLELFEPTESVEGVLDLLLQSGEVVRISEDVILLPETFEQAQEVIRRHIGEHGDITAGDLRDRLGTSRKYSVALLEYLDGTGFTQRVGDKRVLGNSGEG